MNAGKAVIASDRVGAARDLIRDGANGFVHAFGDVEALAARMHDTLADPLRLAAMGDMSRTIIDGWNFAADLAGLKAALAATAAGRSSSR
jgi:glycosyltransferase involved in cell wall biosynthesis